MCFDSNLYLCSGNALDLKITQLDGLLHTLNVIQRKWVYLEPIFSRGALPSEEIRFKRIDEDLYDIMTSVNAGNAYNQFTT